MKRETAGIFLMLCLLVAIAGCRRDDMLIYSDDTQVALPRYTSVDGFYLLNEANMGSNKSTLDYYNDTTGVYTRNLYAEANPTVVKELGDVGNDLKIYGSRLYAVINCSHKVEVMRADNAERIGQIDLPNCRYIAFDGPFAYVSSYVGPVKPDPKAPLGCVFKVDTATLQVVDTVTVGYQPEEMEVRFGKLYVANSGGYRVPDYDSTLSVVDLATFEEIKKIPVAINLHRVRGDKNGRLYVSSRGDYYDVPSRLFVLDCRTDRLVDTLDVPVDNLWIDGDSAYVCSGTWNHVTQQNVIGYHIVDLKTLRPVGSFIKDGTESDIRLPYGIAVHPITKEVYVTDARNKVSAGIVHCYGADGVHRWQAKTGDIPAHFAFKGNLDRNK